MAFRFRNFNCNQLMFFTNSSRQKYAVSIKRYFAFQFTPRGGYSYYNQSKFLYFKIATFVAGCGASAGIASYFFKPSKDVSLVNDVSNEKVDFFKKPSKDISLVNDVSNEKLDFFKNKLTDTKPSREVLGPAQDIGLDLTLFQYQTCPFCCKVRAFLEFYGIPFKVIEVNPVMKQQLNFSVYKKVPILVVKEKDSSMKHQLNDSSVIISILGTMLIDISSGLESILKYYSPMIHKNKDGKEVEEVMNKYFLMYGDKLFKGKSDEFLINERNWRKWADDELVHIISPNIYRTYDEALQTFNYFSEVGEWKKNFNTLERLAAVYIGATAMFFIGKKLKKKYSLKEDVRESLYDSCKLWTKEIGSKKFMGGDLPNLGDLAVYGLLSSIEGCLAFKDLLENTKIGPWYYNVKEAVTNHHGYQTLNI